MAKKELAVINLDQFSIQQLPELQNKKEEVAEKLSAFKYVEITDNASYEEAKKVRTGVRTLRTDLQKEQKAVDKKIKDFILGPVKDAYEGIINEVLPVENKQQEEVSRWEDIKEQERLEKQRIEQERIRNIKTYISVFEQKAYEIIESSTIENVNENKAILDDLVNTEFDFQEFLVEFEQARVRLQYRFDIKCDEIQQKENQRLENERLAKEKAEADEKLRKIQEQQEKERLEREEKAKQEQLQMFEIRKNRLAEIGFTYNEEHEKFYFDTVFLTMSKLKSTIFNCDVFEFENLMVEIKEEISKSEDQYKFLKEIEAKKQVEETTPIIYPAFGDQSEPVLENIVEEGRIIETENGLFDTHLKEPHSENQIDLERKPSEVSQLSTNNSWKNIYSEFFREVGKNDFDAFYHYLSKNYNVPTKK